MVAGALGPGGMEDAVQAVIVNNALLIRPDNPQEYVWLEDHLGFPTEESGMAGGQAEALLIHTRYGENAYLEVTRRER